MVGSDPVTTSVVVALEVTEVVREVNSVAFVKVVEGEVVGNAVDPVSMVVEILGVVSAVEVEGVDDPVPEGVVIVATEVDGCSVDHLSLVPKGVVVGDV